MQNRRISIAPSVVGRDWRRLNGGGREQPNKLQPSHAVQRLLQDVRAGKINVIAVYKVGRLTRSLADVAKPTSVVNELSLSQIKSRRMGGAAEDTTPPIKRMRQGP